jgi:hypothetical protein
MLLEYADEEECDQSAGCVAYRGRRLNAAMACVENDTFAYCYWGYEGCSDVNLAAEDSQGACWWFYEDCGLGGPRLDHEHLRRARLPDDNRGVEFAS